VVGKFLIQFIIGMSNFFRILQNTINYYNRFIFTGVIQKNFKGGPFVFYTNVGLPSYANKQLVLLTMLCLYLTTTAFNLLILSFFIVKTRRFVMNNWTAT